MLKLPPMKQAINRKKAELEYRLLKFRDDIRGVAALEFAMLAPLMLLMYVGTIEISGAVSANRKMSRVASSVADLITQANNSTGGCLTTSEVDDILNIADDIMYPYTQSISILVTGIEIDDDEGEVVWSRGKNIEALDEDDPYTVPEKIAIDDNFLVAAKVSMNYMPSFGWLHWKGTYEIDVDRNSGLPMEEELFLRPRIGDDVEMKTSCS